MPTASRDRTRIRLLLIEHDPWDAGLVQEALDELEERPHENLLGRPVELFHAETLEEAVRSLAEESYDIVLLDLAVTGESALYPLLRLQDAAPELPIVVLGCRADEPLAMTAMREGAAGYLLVEDLDCMPLARALRTAIERQRARQSRRELAVLDDLTGLTSRHGLLLMGETILKLAERWEKLVLLSKVELVEFAGMAEPFAAQARDMALLETAEMMQDLFAEADLIARSGAAQFAAIQVLVQPSTVSLDGRIAALCQKRSRPGGVSSHLVYRTSEQILRGPASLLEQLLCPCGREPYAMAK